MFDYIYQVKFNLVFEIRWLEIKYKQETENDYSTKEAFIFLMLCLLYFYYIHGLPLHVL